MGRLNFSWIALFEMRRRANANGIDASALTATTTWTPNNSRGTLVKVTVQYNFKFLFAVIRSGTLAVTSSSQMVISQ
jgi:hypothetical protein